MLSLPNAKDSGQLKVFPILHFNYESEAIAWEAGRNIVMLPVEFRVI